MREERDKIRLMLYRNTLTNAWLINRLEEKGINTEKTEMSSVLRGVRKGAKAESIIKTSVDILTEYEIKNTTGIFTIEDTQANDSLKTDSNR